MLHTSQCETERSLHIQAKILLQCKTPSNAAQMPFTNLTLRFHVIVNHQNLHQGRSRR